MGLFNRQAEVRADQLANVIMAMADGNFDQPLNAGTDATNTRVYDALRRLQGTLRDQRAESRQTEELEGALRGMIQKHQDGWIDEVIATNRFSGTHSRIAGDINELVAAHIAVKMKVVDVVTAYAQGDFSRPMDRLPGKKAQITEAIDKVQRGLEEADQATKEANDILAGMAQGDLSRRMHGSYHGRFLDLTSSINAVGDSMSEIIEEMRHMSAEHEKGDIDVQINADRFQGAYRTMAQGVNEMVGAHISVKKKAMAVIKAFGEGDFNAPMEQLPGKKAFINQTIEQVRTNLQALNADVVMLNEAAAAGLIETRADVSRHQGDFARIVQGMNQTLETLVEPIITVKGAAGMVNSAAREIAAGNNNLSRRTEEQAASLEETAASVEELTATVKQNAANAQQASQLASEASVVADKGGAVVNKVVSTMASIDESSRKVVEIISVIDGIAFQTNILALNAAVEAARAGEQGRGFAVVAGEVRNLAQRSAAAAKEIKGLISDSVGKVSDGTRLVEEAGHTMTEIVSSINRVNSIMTSIADASAEQSCGIDQINVAVTQMDSMTQQNAAMVEQAAAAAESLQDQAAALEMAVASFKLGREAQADAPRRAEVIALGARRVSGGRGTAVQMADGEWQQY